MEFGDRIGNYLAHCDSYFGLGNKLLVWSFLNRTTTRDYYGKKNSHLGFRIARQRHFRQPDWAATGIHGRRDFGLFGRRFCVCLHPPVAN